MGPPQGLRQTAAPAAGQDAGHGRVEGDAVANGDEDRADPLAGAYRRSHLLDAVQKGCRRSRFGTRFAVNADQSGFGAADGGKTGHHPQMTRRSKPAGVRPAVTVHQHHLGGLRQPAQRACHQRKLAQGEKTRYVVKDTALDGNRRCHLLEVGQPVDRHRRGGQRPPVGDVDTRHPLDRLNGVAFDHPALQTPLQVPGALQGVFSSRRQTSTPPRGATRSHPSPIVFCLSWPCSRTSIVQRRRSEKGKKLPGFLAHRYHGRQRISAAV